MAQQHTSALTRQIIILILGNISCSYIVDILALEFQLRAHLVSTATSHSFVIIHGRCKC